MFLALVCNLGDMLDRLTGGFYRSTPYRARNPGARGRPSFPLFYAPGFDAEIVPLPAQTEIDDDFGQRWIARASTRSKEPTVIT